MIKKLLSSCILVCISSFAHASLQAQIDALPNVGGEIKLPCGDYTNGDTVAQVFLPSDVALVGSGACTVVPPITAKNNTVRKYRLRIENLTVKGTSTNNYIGIDFRNVSASRVRNVVIENVQYGVLLYLDAYYNVIEDAIIDIKSQCFQIVDGANENIIRGGKCQHESGQRVLSSIGMWVRNANSVKVFGTSFENLGDGIKLDTGALGTVIVGPRFENMVCGIDLMQGSDRTSILGIYAENLQNNQGNNAICGNTPYQYIGFPKSKLNL